jgi:photosystem II oxygen-evolving enhancer protein 3
LFCSFQQDGARREAIKTGAAAIGAAFLPAAANAAVGESPRFSVFGLLGDGTSYSEGAAYGSDQSTKTYSPYSVYGNVDENSLYKPDNPEYSARKKAVLAETRKRLAKLPAYVEKKAWFEVSDELSRFMYETRGAAKGLATTPEQKKACTAFFKSIEQTDLAARRKNQELARTSAADTIPKLDAFLATL